jgi:hypothetical protein
MKRAIPVLSASAAIGGAVYLQKKEKLYFCYVTETATSATVATRYCKPVE